MEQSHHNETEPGSPGNVDAHAMSGRTRVEIASRTLDELIEEFGLDRATVTNAQGSFLAQEINRRTHVGDDAAVLVVLAAGY